MLFLFMLLMLIGFVLYITVVVDMFKSKVWLGFLGLFLFPFTFYHAFMNYSGNRKTMGLALTITILIPYSYMQYENSVGERELEPFIAAVHEQHSMQCIIGSGLMSRGGTTYYKIQCYPENLNQINYINENELVSNYESAFVKPVLELYSNTFGLIEDKGVVLGIRSPSNLIACYEIENPGIIKESKSSFENC